jgi:hypothetical protein
MGHFRPRFLHGVNGDEFDVDQHRGEFLKRGHSLPPQLIHPLAQHNQEARQESGHFPEKQQAGGPPSIRDRSY